MAVKNQRIHRASDYRIAIVALLVVTVWVTVSAWQSGSSLQAKFLATQAPTQGTGVIEGVLRDSSGKPEAGVSVGATTATADPYTATAFAGGTQTDTNGRYRLEEIPAGRYYISAGRAQFPTFYPGTLDIGEGRVVAVSAGATVSDINFATALISSEPKAPITAPNQTSFVAATNTPGILNLYVSIQVEGGGKFPVYANGRSPRLTLTNIATNASYEMPFANITITVPRNLTTVPVEYKVAVADLPDGYAVKSITYRADESGVRYEDVLARPLKISIRANDTTFAGGNGSTAAPDLPVKITLTRMPVPSPRGVRVAGRTGNAVRRELPLVGEKPPDFRSSTDAGIYISGSPGILFNDGSFEFAGVAPGVHTIILAPGLLAAQVSVQDRDVEGVSLQAVPAFPYNVLSSQTQPAGVAGRVLTSPTLALRVLDEATKQPINSGYITLNGIGGSSRNYFGASTPIVRIPKLLPGKYAVTAEATGYKSRTQTITVGNVDTSLDVQLTREPK